VFDAGAATQLVASHPPTGTVDAYQYIAGVDPTSLEAAAFEWGNEEHAKLVQAALDKLYADREQQSALASAAAAAATLIRKAKYHPDNADTWTLNPVQFFTTAVSENDVNAAADGEAVLTQIKKAFIVGNGPKKSRLQPKVGVAFHAHLQKGSWGIAYMFVLEDDFTVTPWVIDIAKSRTSTDMYHWKHGGTGFTPPEPDLPKKQPPGGKV
jgi:hypothetical protein